MRARSPTITATVFIEARYQFPYNILGGRRPSLTTSPVDPFLRQIDTTSAQPTLIPDHTEASAGNLLYKNLDSGTTLAPSLAVRLWQIACRFQCPEAHAGGPSSYQLPFAKVAATISGKATVAST